MLFRQGDPSSELFGIVNGEVAILTRSPDGRESLVAVLDEGSLFGELGALRRRPALGRRAARSRRPTSLVLSYDVVHAAIDEHPTLLWMIVRLLARRLRNTDESLAERCSSTSRRARPSGCWRSPATPSSSGCR